MGMYDDIKFKIKCPNCDEEIDNFQSKDGACVMHSLEFWEVGNFYASCHNCNTWIEYSLESKRPNRKLTIKDYKREVKIPTKKEQEEQRRKYKAFAKLLKQPK